MLHSLHRRRFTYAKRPPGIPVLNTSSPQFDGLISLWTFQDIRGSGVPAHEHLGPQLTYGGSPGITQTPEGLGLSFNGSSDNLRLATSDPLKGLSKFTVVIDLFWPSSLGNDNYVISSAGTGQVVGFGIVGWPDSAGNDAPKDHYGYFQRVTSTWDDAGPISYDDWGTLILAYENGRQEWTTSLVDGAAVTHAGGPSSLTGKFRLGSRDDDSFFGGIRVREYRVYNRFLESSERQHIAQPQTRWDLYWQPRPMSLVGLPAAVDARISDLHPVESGVTAAAQDANLHPIESGVVG